MKKVFTLDKKIIITQSTIIYDVWIKEILYLKNERYFYSKYKYYSAYYKPNIIKLLIYDFLEYYVWIYCYDEPVLDENLKLIEKKYGFGVIDDIIPEISIEKIRIENKIKKEFYINWESHLIII
jgi:hypothetical protein